MVVSDYSINLEDSGKLTIVSVEPRHAGNYRFTVSNSSGSVQGQVRNGENLNCPSCDEE